MSDKIYINSGKIDTAEIMKIVKLTDFSKCYSKKRNFDTLNLIYKTKKPSAN